MAAAAAEGNFGQWALRVSAATAVAGRQARQGSGSESTSAVASTTIAHRHPEPCTPLGRRTKSLERRPKPQPGRPKPQPQPPPTTRTLVGGTPGHPESESLTGRRAFTCTLSSPRASGSQRTREATRRYGQHVPKEILKPAALPARVHTTCPAKGRATCNLLLERKYSLLTYLPSCDGIAWAPT